MTASQLLMFQVTADTTFVCWGSGLKFLDSPSLWWSRCNWRRS